MIAVDTGTTLLHYRILSRLGEGGMGVVYRAEDARLGRTVALKVLRDDLVADTGWEQRFQREVRAASAVSHPGIATIYDLHRDGPTLFYTMEFVEGPNLRDLLKKGPVPIPDLLRGCLQVAEAMAEAHRRGIVHRDLKPENVVASTSGYFKILDFGLAHFVTDALASPDGGSRLQTISRDTTASGKIVGTVAYMSPEQAQGMPTDARSDVFSIGGLIHELATGTSPFRRDNAIATFHAIVHEQPNPMSSLRDGVPKELEWIVGRCLAKRPEDRYQSAADLAEDLRTLHLSSASGVRKGLKLQARPPASRRRGLRLAAAIVAAAAIVTLGIVALKRETGRPSSPSPATLPSAPLPIAPAATAPGEKLLAVAAFTNNSPDPNDAWLAQGIAQMITTEMAGVPDLKVVSTEKINDLLAAAGRTGADGVDKATATELARWAGAGIVVSGSIFRAGGSLRIDAQASDTESGRVLAAAKAEGSDVFKMVGSLTSELRGGLSVPSSPAAATQVATASPEAYRRYTEGTRRYGELRYDEAAQAFAQAAKADPSFTPALLRQGMSLYLGGKTGEGLALLKQAAAAPGRLPHRDGRLLELVDALFVKKDGAHAEEVLKAFAREFPGDVEGEIWKAKAEADLAGQPLEAMRTLRDVLDREPDNLTAVSLMSDQIAALGRPEDAAAILGEYMSRHPDASRPIERMIRIYRRGPESGKEPKP